MQANLDMQVGVSRLRATNGRIPGVQLGSFGYRKSGLQLGALAGNTFTLTLRGIKAEDKEKVAEAVRSLRQSGFINYFGLQRFGAGRVPTHEIGAVATFSLQMKMGLTENGLQQE
jgi:tRNA pseudouridine13 synthase